MKNTYSSPEWNLILTETNDILTESGEDVYTKDY